MLPLSASRKLLQRTAAEVNASRKHLADRGKYVRDRRALADETHSPSVEHAFREQALLVLTKDQNTRCCRVCTQPLDEIQTPGIGET